MKNKKPAAPTVPRDLVQTFKEAREKLIQERETLMARVAEINEMLGLVAPVATPKRGRPIVAKPDFDNKFVKQTDGAVPIAIVETPKPTADVEATA